MKKTLSTPRFLQNENGSLSVEACFAVPILAWAILATYVFFDAFKTLNVSQKATYTIADMISREEAAIDDDYIASMFEMFEYLAGENGESAIRVSVVEMVVDGDTGVESLELVWSEAMKDGEKKEGLTNIDQIEERIPTLSASEQLVVVESIQQWTPAFGGVLASYNFGETALARPRFAPRICWQTTVGCLTPAGGAGT